MNLRYITICHVNVCTTLRRITIKLYAYDAECAYGTLKRRKNIGKTPANYMFLPLQAEKSYGKIKWIYDVIDTTNVTQPDVINGGVNGYEQTGRKH